jgi:hypothetical protein
LNASDICLKVLRIAKEPEKRVYEVEHGKLAFNFTEKRRVPVGGLLEVLPSVKLKPRRIIFRVQEVREYA